MATGTIKWFDGKKGYGFITQDDGSNDVFLHYSAIQGEEGKFRTVYEGDKVEYEVSSGDKGPQAASLMVLERAPRKKFNKSRKHSKKSEED